MFVIGATKEAYFEKIRQFCPDHFFLVPGVGAQGGDAAATVQAGWRGRLDAGSGKLASSALTIVNSSRAILYASSGADFADAARRVAVQTRDTLRAAQMAAIGANTAA